MASKDLTKDVVVTILGCGFMGTALLNGMLESTKDTTSRIKQYIACVRRQESAEKLKQSLTKNAGVVDVSHNDNVRAISKSQVVVLGFQPGDTLTVLGDPQIAQAINDKLIISMVAGVSCQKIRQILSSAHRALYDQNWSNNFHVIRVVPSIGAQINASATLVSESNLDPSMTSFVSWMFDQIGTTEIVLENDIDTAVAISATCHALTVTAIDAVVDGSVSRGIARSTALRIAAQCLKSASSLLLGEMNLEELKDSMSVPRGITTEAWIHLDAGHVRPAISQAVRQSVDYANKMS